VYDRDAGNPRHCLEYRGLCGGAEVSIPDQIAGLLCRSA
jgi:hypothetical protein